jgi:hypothetical protein
MGSETPTQPQKLPYRIIYEVDLVREWIAKDGYEEMMRTIHAGVDRSIKMILEQAEKQHGGE